MNGEAITTTKVAMYERVAQPGGCVLLRPVMVGAEQEIGTREAAKLLGCSQRTVQQKCDEGVLKEGVEWRKLRSRCQESSHYRIKLEAVLRLKGS
jgi:hypothetical protein